MTAAKKVLLVSTVAPDEELAGQLRRALGTEDATVRVVVPTAGVSWLEWLTNDDRQAQEEARERAQQAAEVIDENRSEVEVDRTSQDTNTAEAVRDALRSFPADEIVVFTRPGGGSRRLRDDLTSMLSPLGIPIRYFEQTPKHA